MEKLQLIKKISVTIGQSTWEYTPCTICHELKERYLLIKLQQQLMCRKCFYNLYFSEDTGE